MACLAWAAEPLQAPCLREASACQLRLTLVCLQAEVGAPSSPALELCMGRCPRWKAGRHGTLPDTDVSGSVEEQVAAASHLSNSI